ncbi:MAG: tRNA(fMet)-specific endonuclease VapC [Deltaproteobacteria bacterium ADurb.Bin135]|jgi:hypothetical protein|nr:MAG: tRNA(fMet)-specific endonuclease VapC [Deltaproteobacteria bacterium ADurb.Bin135]
MPDVDRMLDSVILIDHLNGVSKATDYLRNLAPERTAVSVITRTEILVGMEGSDIDEAKNLLDKFVLLSIDGPIADKAAELRRKYGWKLPDAFQAALAIQNNAKLVTRNTKDFDPNRHKFVEVPYVI